MEWLEPLAMRNLSISLKILCDVIKYNGYTKCVNALNKACVMKTYSHVVEESEGFGSYRTQAIGYQEILEAMGIVIKSMQHLEIDNH